MIRQHRSRSGFTLIELIVVMSVIIIIATIALVVVPNAIDQDRTTDGASRIQQFLMIAKSRAARDNLPRGISLIDDGTGFGTTVQYIEAPPLFIPPRPTDTVFDKATAPHVEFTFSPAGDGSMLPFPTTPPSDPPPPTDRVIKLKNLPSDLVAEIAQGGSVIIPELHVWFSFKAGRFDPATQVVTPIMVQGVSPYPEIGAASTPPGSPSHVSYLFAVYGPPVPLLGEPVQQLPTNIGVDLNAGASTGVPAGNNLLFAPSGELMSATSGQVMLWVRDKTKGTSNLDFANAGEQQVVAIKTHTGALGAFLINWDAVDPFKFAKLGSTQ